MTNLSGARITGALGLARGSSGLGLAEEGRRISPIAARGLAVMLVPRGRSWSETALFDKMMHDDDFTTTAIHRQASGSLQPALIFVVSQTVCNPGYAYSVWLSRPAGILSC